MANYKYPNAKARKRAMRKAERKYKRTKMTGFAVRFHNEHDADVIAKLKSCENKSDYIRQLIRRDISEN